MHNKRNNFNFSKVSDMSNELSVPDVDNHANRLVGEEAALSVPDVDTDANVLVGEEAPVVIPLPDIADEAGEEQRREEDLHPLPETGIRFYSHCYRCRICQLRYPKPYDAAMMAVVNR